MYKLWRDYRILLYGLVLLLLLGTHELTTLRYFDGGLHPTTLRQTGYAAQLQQKHLYQDGEQSLARVINELYPENPEATFLRGMEEEYSGGGLQSACTFYARAAASGVRHSEDLLYMAAVCTEIKGQGDLALQQAVNRWRRSHPHSEKYRLQLRFAGFGREGDPARFAAASLAGLPYARFAGYDDRQQIVFVQLKGAEVHVAELRRRLLAAGFVPRTP